MEQLDYNLLYRWFVGLAPDDPVWDPTTFTKNRERLQNGEVFTKFMTSLLNHLQVKPLLSDEHFCNCSPPRFRAGRLSAGRAILTSDGGADSSSG
jgi:transposase